MILDKTPAPEPIGILQLDFAFVDFEASALDDRQFGIRGFPIEFGLCSDDLKSTSFLIRPADAWASWHWAPSSESIHGITWEQLCDEGIPVDEACDLIVGWTEGKLLFGDGGASYDAIWMSRLFEAAGVPMPERLGIIKDYMVAIGMHIRQRDGVPDRKEVFRLMQMAEQAGELADRLFPSCHRAGPDARNAAACFRLAIDEDFRAFCNIEM